MNRITAERILVTTTPVLEGWEIQEYLGMITSRIVTGTGFILDIAASFTDFFGGRSGVYQEQINTITYEVIELLKKQAFLKGANAIVGTRIDHDEISGKGKQMFMVTATGTAVIARKSNGRNEKKLLSNVTQVPANHLEKEIEIERIIKLVKEKEIVYYDSKYGQSDSFNRYNTGTKSLGEVEIDKIWSFLIENQVYEVAEDIVEQLKAGFISYENVIKYFKVIDPEIAKKNLYNGLLKKGNIAKHSEKIINENNLIDYNFVLPLISSEDYLIRISALSLLKNHKEYYLQDDILLMEKISEKINSSFPNIGVIYEDKNMWQCECGKVNKNSVIFCKSCKKNIKGFTINDPEPDEVLKILKNRIDALKRIFLANPE